MSLAARIALAALSRRARHRFGPHPSQVADLRVPRGPGPFPVAVVLHGGSWTVRYGRLVTAPIAADLARRGIASWNLEYRRIGGGGGWPATFEDVGAGIDALAALGDPRLDLARVVAVGHSAGGQLALWAAARPGLPPGAPGAAPQVALTHVAALAAVCDLEAAGRVGAALVGGTPAEVPERFAQADPMRRLPLDVPVLLVHPRDDRTVSVQRSRAYAQAARRLGGAVELVEPEAGGHVAPIDPRSPAWRLVAERLEAWLAPAPAAAEGARAAQTPSG